MEIILIFVFCYVFVSIVASLIEIINDYKAISKPKGDGKKLCFLCKTEIDAKDHYCQDCSDFMQDNIHSRYNKNIH